MKMFKGVDWTIYVKMRNKERKSGEAKKDYDDENLLDEDDVVPEVKPEEEKKEAVPVPVSSESPSEEIKTDDIQVEVPA
jgi:hypothetical protein